MADIYTVELRISDRDLSPSEITKALGIQPTHSRQSGERRTASSNFDEAVWSYSGNAGEEWPSLEAGLASLMSELLPKRDLIAAYVKRFDACWWCGHFQDSFDGGPVLSPELLRNLANFGIPVALRSYRSTES